MNGEVPPPVLVGLLVDNRVNPDGGLQMYPEL